jgi:hypothetical protein
VLSDGEGAAFKQVGEEVLLSGTCKTGMPAKQWPADMTIASLGYPLSMVEDMWKKSGTAVCQAGNYS